MNQTNQLNQYNLKTKIGWIQIVEENEKITKLSFLDEKEVEKSKKCGKPSPSIQKICKQLEEYLDGKRQDFSIPIKTNGTPFQEKVWEELQKIPYGETICYGELAKRIGNPKASRAVGMANNKNPIAIIIPCHRVIGKNGKLVGYASGVDKKEALLILENENKS